MDTSRLTREQWQKLFDDYAAAYHQTQREFDLAVRGLGAGGVAVTVSLATALHKLTSLGIAAVVVFLVSLGCQLVSYETAQRDLKLRAEQALVHEPKAWKWNRWTHATTWLNRSAGAAVVAAGVLLAFFVRNAT